ncbi:Olfactory receptor 1496 [Merluccius polli]|uniref:Olfactory receptor n=1 Tax=Merluccius polli TaxID=89951 RepID=A0AA47NW80_MERPO|nr:Olfactory receptor 1496 [Merluccius polli]
MTFDAGNNDDNDSAAALVLTLHGLNDTQANRHAYFAVTLLLYSVTVLANLTVVAVVLAEKSLHEPMYAFLCNLCLNSVYGASSFYPKLLHDLLADAHRISYGGCLAQIFGVYSYVFCEFTNLAVMAYDRYVAICLPLKYHAIMTPRWVGQLLLLTWSVALLESVVGVALTSRLPLCRLHVRKMFCTNWVVVRLSCADTTPNNVYGFVLVVCHLAQVLLIVVSYAHIIGTSLRSVAGRRKFFQTCLPHLTTLAVFTLSLMFDSMFSRYGSSIRLQALSNLMAAEFLVVPPLINPLVYGMNLQRIHTQVLRMLGSNKVQTLT